VCETVVRQLSSYDHERVASLQSAVGDWAEEKIRAARDTYTQLDQSLQYFRQLDDDSSSALTEPA